MRAKLRSVRNFLPINQGIADAGIDCEGDARGMTTIAFKSGHHALRRGRVSLSGQLYLVTACTAHRRPLFASYIAAERTCAILRDPATWPTARALVWILMPDHWHGLVELDGAESLSIVMARMKGIVSRRATVQSNGPIWQRSFHDHALRAEEVTLDVGRYVLANSVRAGLVDHWWRWRWRGGDLLADFEADLSWHDG